MSAYHIQGGKDVRLSQPQQMMASERKMIESACGGDIIGIFDSGNFLHRRYIDNLEREVRLRGDP